MLWLTASIISVGMTSVASCFFPVSIIFSVTSLIASSVGSVLRFGKLSFDISSFNLAIFLSENDHFSLVLQPKGWGPNSISVKMMQ